MDQVAIIGAKGFVGRALCDFFNSAGWTCLPIGREDPLPRHAIKLVIDCNGEGRRFWCNENPDGSYQRNVEAVAERLFAINSDAYVYISTVDVYGPGREQVATSREDADIHTDMLDTYGRHKHLAECLVAEQGQRPLVLRCGTIIGPGLRKNPVFDLLNDAPLRMTGASTLNLIRIETLGAALMCLLERSFEGVYNIAASAPITVSQIRAIIADHRGISPQAMPEHADQITMNYELSTTKISALLEMPTSEAALHTFLEKDVFAVSAD